MNGLLAVKLRRDMAAIWPRLALMVVAIAVSLTVFGGVLGAWAAIGRETSGAYASTEPASATIVLDRGVDVARMAALTAEVRTRSGVLEATGRSQFTSEVEVDGQARSVPLQVFVAAPEDPMRMARFDVQNASWPPQPGQIFVRRDSLALLGLSVGDTVTLKENRTSLRVAATVYDPSLAPSPQQQTGAAYLSTASLPAATLNQVKVQVAEPGQRVPTRDRDTVVAVAGELGAWLQRDKGLAVREVQVPQPYAHPHQWQADVLLLSLLVGAVAALLLSTILVANMLNNVFTRQIPQIGIMKAVGVPTGRIGRMYLTMTLLVAAAATAVAIGPAVAIGRFGLNAFLGMLGIEASSLAAPWWTYAVIVVVGLAVPPLIALVPLVRTSRTTVREAIDHHGGATGVTTRALSSLRINRSLLMALRNTIRRPARFVLSVSLLASAGAVFVAGMSLNAGTQAIDDERKDRRTWDVEVALAAPASPDTLVRLVGTVSGVTRVDPWNRTQTAVADPGRIPVTRTYPDQGHGSVAVTTLAADAMLAMPPLLEGRWLAPGETGAVVLNQITRDSTVPDVHAGGTVQLSLYGKATPWHVVGIVQEREGGSGGAYVTDRGFATATGRSEVNQLRITTAAHDEPARAAAADAVRTALAAAGIEVTTATSVSRGDAVSAGHLGPVLVILLGIAVPLGIVGTIGLGSTMSANVLDRTREFAVMHAIGAPPATVRRIVRTEGMLLALASCVAAAIPALVLTKVLGDGLGNLFMSAPLPFRISPLAVGIWIALALLGAALATDVAASRASRTTVREALTQL